jgi:hypothetical protein
VVAVKGESPFAYRVRKALEYAQSRGVDLSGVEVEVVEDPSVKDFGAYAEHLGGLRFRIRYHPRYANDAVLAAHEAGHVAYWAWAVKTGRTQFFNNPDIIEPLAEAFGAVAARQLFGVPVTFKGAPMNLTQALPQRYTYVTATVGSQPTAVKVPEWGDSLSLEDYLKRYRAGVLLSPYFYNMTNWAHVFGNFTAMPGDVVETVHKAWRRGAVEVVPGWGAVWRTAPTWSWQDASSADEVSNSVSTQQKPSDTPPADVSTAVPQGGNTQKNDTAASNAKSPQVGAQKVVVYAQTSADVPLPPSGVQSPRYFSSDIAPSSVPPEWSRYISGRGVLVVLRNWPSLDTATLKETRRDHVVGAGVVSEGRLRFEHRIPVPQVVDPNAWIELVDEKTGRVLARLKSDELYKLTSPVTLYWSHVAVEEKWPGWERFVERAKELEEKLGTWLPSGDAVMPRWYRPPSDAHWWQHLQRQRDSVTQLSGSQQTTTVTVRNAPTEYIPPKVPDDMRKQFYSMLSELKKLGEDVNLRNAGEVHDKFIQLRDSVLNIARTYPQLIDETNKAVEETGSRIREVSDKLYDALAKAAGRDSFWRGDGDVKTPIGVYKYDPSTGAFLLSLYDRPTAENIVGFIKDDGTPVVVKKTQNMSEALEEYSKLSKSQTSEQASPKQTNIQQSGGGQQTGSPSPLDVTTKIPVIGPVLQTVKLHLQTPPSRSKSEQTDSHPRPESAVKTQPPSVHSTTHSNNQRDFLWPVYSATDFLVNALKTGAGIKLAALGITALDGAGLSTAEFVEHKPQSERRLVYNRRRGSSSATDSPMHSEFVQLPSNQQKSGEFTAVERARPPDHVLVETKVKPPEPSPPSAGKSEFVQRSKRDEPAVIRPARPSDYVLAEQEMRRSEETRNSAQTSSGYRPADYIVIQQSGSSKRSAQLSDIQLAQAQDGTETKRYRGKPVAVPI